MLKAVFTRELHTCNKRERKRLPNSHSVWPGENFVSKPDAASNLVRASIRLCGQTPENLLGDVSFCCTSAQLYQLPGISQNGEEKKGRNLSAFSATKEIDSCSKPTKALIWSSSLSAQSRRVRSRLRKCRTFYSLRVLGSKGLSFKVPGYELQIRVAIGCAASLHTYAHVLVSM